VSRVFVRGTQGWITCFWRHLDRVPVPFGELAWDHARRHLVGGARDATEQQIADGVAALLTRAYQGPQEDAPKMPKRDRRIAARTKAATPPPAPATASGGAGDDGTPDSGTVGSPSPASEDLPLAEVIPLGIFGPFREPDKRW
jgi:putative transposase